MELTNDFLLLLIIRTGSFAVFFIGYRVKETIFAVPWEKMFDINSRTSRSMKVTISNQK